VDLEIGVFPDNYGGVIEFLLTWLIKRDKTNQILKIQTTGLLPKTLKRHIKKQAKN